MKTIAVVVDSKKGKRAKVSTGQPKWHLESDVCVQDRVVVPMSRSWDLMDESMSNPRKLVRKEVASVGDELMTKKVAEKWGCDVTGCS